MLQGISNIKSSNKNEEAAKKMAEKLSENQNPILVSASSSSNKSDYRLATIKSKMKQGRKLSSGDMSYLREHAPALHRKAVAIEKKRDEFEQKIRSCKSKVEFDRLRIDVTQSVVDVGEISCNTPNIDTTQAIGAVQAPSADVMNAIGITVPSMNVNTAAGINISANLNSSINSASSSNQQDSNTLSFESDSTYYLYCSLDDAYRTFKQSESYRKLPFRKQDKQKINIKV